MKRLIGSPSQLARSAQPSSGTSLGAHALAREVAEEVGRLVDADVVYSEQTPEDKLEVVRAVRARAELRPVLMEWDLRQGPDPPGGAGGGWGAGGLEKGDDGADVAEAVGRAPGDGTGHDGAGET